MKVEVVRTSFERDPKKGRLLQRKANQMLMESTKRGTPLPEEYIKIRNLAEEHLGIWRFQEREKERYKQLGCRLPSSQKVVYRTVKLSNGDELIFTHQGSLDVVGYFPPACKNCLHLPAGSADCIYHECE